MGHVDLLLLDLFQVFVILYTSVSTIPLHEFEIEQPTEGQSSTHDRKNVNNNQVEECRTVSRFLNLTSDSDVPIGSVHFVMPPTTR